jgi:hypothetical protein
MLNAECGMPKSSPGVLSFVPFRDASAVAALRGIAAAGDQTPLTPPIADHQRTRGHRTAAHSGRRPAWRRDPHRR